MKSRALPFGADAANEALELLRQTAATAPAGYVRLQPAPYRRDHLLGSLILELTEPGSLIFEGGVSAGYFSRVLVSSGRRVHGFEIDAEQAEIARAVCERVVVGDLQDLDENSLTDEYDVLLFADTLEHLPRPVELLTRLRPKVRRGGHLLISVPNVAHWSIRASLAAGRFTYTDRGILDRTHLRFFTKRSLAAMVSDAGYEMVWTGATVPVPGLTHPLTARLAHRFGNLWPSFFGYVLIALARPR